MHLLLPLRLFEALFSAFRAGHLQLAFSSRDPQLVLAFFALKDFMCPKLLDPVYYSLYLGPYRPPVFDELIVFRSPAIDIARQHSEYSKSENKIRDKNQRHI